MNPFRLYHPACLRNILLSLLLLSSCNKREHPASQHGNTTPVNSTKGELGESIGHFGGLDEHKTVSNRASHDETVIEAVREGVYGEGIGKAKLLAGEWIKKGDLSMLTSMVASLSKENISAAGKADDPKDREGELIGFLGDLVASEYANGRLGRIENVMLAVSRGDDGQYGIGYQTMIQIFRALRSSHRHAILGAFEEICANPPSRIDFASSLNEIAATAADLGGYPETLSQIPRATAQEQDLFHYAEAGILDRWMGIDSIECSRYVRDLPDGERKYDLACYMVQNLARSGNIAEAEQWFDLLPKNSKRFAETSEVLMEMRKTNGAPPPKDE